jgi:gp16 family phage-associated protein
MCTENRDSDMTLKDVKLKLRKKGYTIPSWAEVNGYNYYTVYKTLKRWAGKGEPKGIVSREIMKDIERTLSNYR